MGFRVVDEPLDGILRDGGKCDDCLFYKVAETKKQCRDEEDENDHGDEFSTGEMECAQDKTGEENGEEWRGQLEIASEHEQAENQPVTQKARLERSYHRKSQVNAGAIARLGR